MENMLFSTYSQTLNVWTFCASDNIELRCSWTCSFFCFFVDEKCEGSRRPLDLPCTSCVRSKRPHVCRHHAHMCFNMWAWCRYTRGRFWTYTRCTWRHSFTDLTSVFDPELVTSFFFLNWWPLHASRHAVFSQISNDFFEGQWSLMPVVPDVQYMPDPSSMSVSWSLSFLVSAPTTMKSAVKCDKHCALTCCSQPTLYFRGARTTWPRLTGALHTHPFCFLN